MPFVTTKEMLLDAQKNRYAVGAFNVENMEMAQAIIAAAEEEHSSVILQTTPSTLKYASPQLFAAMVKCLAENTKANIALHLDHGSSFELAARALCAGYSSIMIDGSKLPLNENIALTAKVVQMCESVGVPVEGELGQVGGKEDDMESEGGGYTIPKEAVRFEKETGLYSMAVGVGTAHGIYAQAPVLKVELISELGGVLNVPMVLHGASGLSDDVIKDCIARGICKVNFATELRQAYTKGVRTVLNEDAKAFDPKLYGKLARENVKQVVKSRINVCGSAR